HSLQFIVLLGFAVCHFLQESDLLPLIPLQVATWIKSQILQCIQRRNQLIYKFNTGDKKARIGIEEQDDFDDSKVEDATLSMLVQTCQTIFVIFREQFMGGFSITQPIALQFQGKDGGLLKYLDFGGFKLKEDQFQYSNFDILDNVGIINSIFYPDLLRAAFKVANENFK
ncbi:MAG: hypothetical protein EZS28_013648, partial [Streblomastix strix]